MGWDSDTNAKAIGRMADKSKDEVIQAISYFMATDSSYRVMMEALPIHPTVAEFLPTILSELAPI